MSDIIIKIFIFIAFLGPLVFFHELGHFFFARLFGVRVEVFSIGFGPKIFKVKKGFTQYALSIIPLGGYVKMFGDDPFNMEAIPEEDRQYAFTHKNKWQRFWIVFGGPLANFIFAYFLFFSLFMIGEKVPEARFGYIPQNSYFSNLNIQEGDRLVGVNNLKILGFTDLSFSLPGERINKILVLRNGIKTEVKLDIENQDFFKEFLSLSPQIRKPILLDLKSGDKLWVAKRGEKQEKLILTTFLKGFSDRVEFIKEDGNQSELIVKKAQGIKDFLEQGVAPLDLQIKSIIQKSPADKSGLRGKDVLARLNGKPLDSFEDLRNSLQKIEDNKEVIIGYFREGIFNETKLIPKITVNGDRKVKTIGIYGGGEFEKLNYVNGPSFGFFESIIMSFPKTWDGMVTTFSGYKKLITAEVSVKSIGGPIAIGKVASDSLSISLSYFFKLMAIISINLGVINLFPIPVLDGGHILFIFFEIVNRGPLSKKKMQVAQQLGLSLLLILILFALVNDFKNIL